MGILTASLVSDQLVAFGLQGPRLPRCTAPSPVCQGCVHAGVQLAQPQTASPADVPLPGRCWALFMLCCRHLDVRKKSLSGLGFGEGSPTGHGSVLVKGDRSSRVPATPPTLAYSSQAPLRTPGGISAGLQGVRGSACCLVG